MCKNMDDVQVKTEIKEKKTKDYVYADDFKENTG